MANPNRTFESTLGNVPENSDADSDVVNLYESYDEQNQVFTRAPKERFRLGYLDVGCLLINRMVGSGIFNSPQRIMQGTLSTGTSLLFWFAGIIYCLAGTHVYMEYGMNVPRYSIEGVERSVPRSGGDLNYVRTIAFVSSIPT